MIEFKDTDGNLHHRFLDVNKMWRYLNKDNKAHLVYYVEGVNFINATEYGDDDTYVIPEEIHQVAVERSGRAPLSYSGYARPEEEDPNSSSGSGWYAYTKNCRDPLYDPERMLETKRFFRGYQEPKYNDCLIHSMNFYMNYPYFTKREQVIAFLANRKKRSYEWITHEKEKFGLDIMWFKRLYAMRDEIFSPVCLQQWKGSQRPTPNELVDLLMSSSHSKFILRHRFSSKGEGFSHAIAVHKHSKHTLKIQDPREKEELYLANPEASRVWNIRDFCATYGIGVFVFEGRKESATKIREFHARMRQIMGMTEADPDINQNLEKARAKRKKSTKKKIKVVKTKGQRSGK